MQVSSPMNINTIQTFMGMQTDTNITHFREEQNGDIVCFHIDSCDRCNAEMVGANPITFIKKSVGKMKGLMLVCGLDPTDVVEEGGCNDAGEVLCMACHAKEQ